MVFFIINSYTIKNVVSLLTSVQNSKQRIITILKNEKKYAFPNPLTFYFNTIRPNTMDSITDLAEVAEEQEIQNESNHLDMDITENITQEFVKTQSELINGITIEKVPYKENEYQHSFHIHRNHYRHIVGSHSVILKRLCSETETVIRVSKKKKHVVISGSIQKKIVHAKHQIDKLIENSKNKLRYTHFISTPTNSSNIRENFLSFKENVLKSVDPEISEINENIFQKPEKLHLTICMLHLLEKADEQKAIEALNYCKREIIESTLKETGPLTIEFRGLKCMNNNPTKTKVLYVTVHEKTGSLQNISDKIYDYFLQQGLSRREYDKVTLHMTVMNTFYLKRKKQIKVIKHFDATQILKVYKDIYLGEITLSTFHISNLMAKSPDGYFEATAKINF